MFGIVAPHDDQLPLPVEIERIDNAEPGLARPAAREPELPPEQHLDNGKKQKYADEKGE